MKNKFKLGQIVRCIEPHIGRLEKGALYRITNNARPITGGSVITVEDLFGKDKPGSRLYATSRF